jgi:Flp pilus assembly pilin Flp
MKTDGMSALPDRTRTCRRGGATIVEYALTLILIAGVCLGAISIFGPSLSAMFSALASAVTK